MSTRERIDNFLQQKRIAIVGVSRNGRDFSRQLFREFRSRGFDVVPVHPEAIEIEGSPCYQRLQDVSPPVDGALLMTASAKTLTVVKDCVEAGVRRVWMYRAAGKGAVNQEAALLCEQHGIDVVPGYCPFMFLDKAGPIHRAHGLLLKLTGRYPIR